MAFLRWAEVWKIWALWPLAALVIHIVLFPTLYETKKISEVPSVPKLIEDRGGYLGMYRNREIHVTYGRVGDPKYVARRILETPGKIGVVAAQFLSLPDIATRSGPVVTAIQSRIQRIDPALAQKFGPFVRAASDLDPGGIAAFEIGRGALPAIGDYPIGKVVLVLLKETQDAKAYTASVSSGLKAAFNKDHLTGREGMIVTFLGIGTRFQPVSTEQFLNILFDAIPNDTAGGRIFIGLFEGWPHDFLISVTRDLDRVWNQRSSVGLAETIFALPLRFALVCLTLCLFVCSFVTTLSIKNAFLLSGAYLGSAFGSEKLVSFFFSTFDPGVVVLFSLGVQLLLAVFFPVVAKLNPRGVFNTAEAG